MKTIRKEFLLSIKAALSSLFLLCIIISPILSRSDGNRIVVAGILSMALILSGLSFRFYFEGREARPEQPLLMAYLYKTIPLCITMLSGIFQGLYML